MNVAQDPGRPRSRGVRRLSSVLVVLALAAGTRPTSSARAAGDGGDGPAPPRTYALLIGCTEYPELQKVVPADVYERSVRLEGCANDVDLVRKTLVERFRARPDDLVALEGWPDDPAARPTRANVRKALEALAARTYAPGDRVVVHYSGHGVQVPDDDGDEEDGLDEAWFVADSSGGPAEGFTGTIRDDEIGAAVRRIRARGARVWCIFDCCHSATGLRVAEREPTRRRRLDPRALGFTVKPAATAATGRRASADLDGARDGVVAFYAAQSFQEVPEVRLPSPDGPRTSYGLLTASVVRGIERSRDGLTYAELYEQVVAAYRDFEQQHVVQPYAEGDLTGGVLGGGGTQEPLVVRRLEGGRLELSVGSLFGIAPGTELTTYAPGRLGDPDGRVGRVAVRRVRPEASTVAPVEGSDDGWTRGATAVWPAQVARLELGDTRIPIALLDAGGSEVPAARASAGLRAILEDPDVRARHPAAEARDDQAWGIVVDASGDPVALRPRRAGPSAPSLRTSLGGLRGDLATVYRGENLLRLASRAPEMLLPPNLRLAVDRVRADGTREPVASGARLPPGTNLRIRLEKDRARGPRDAATLDVYVFWLDPRLGIRMLYPTEKSGPRLGRDDVTDGGRPIELAPQATSDESVGLERLLVFAARKREDAPPLDLRFLAARPPSEAWRGRSAPTADGDPAARLLFDLALGPPDARGGTKAVDSGAGLSLGVFAWLNGWASLHAPPPDAKQVAATLPPRPSAPPPPGSPPDAWAFGPEVRLAQAGSAGAWCALVARGDGAVHVLLDLDGEVAQGDRTPQGIERKVRDGSFGAEVALRLEPTRIVAWYDTDHDGAFDLVLVDVDRDERADVAYRRGPEGWRRTTGLDEPVLSTTNLTYVASEDVERTVLDRLQALAGD